MPEPLIRPLFDDHHVVVDQATVDAEIEAMVAAGDLFRQAAFVALDAVDSRWEGTSARRLGQHLQSEAHDAMAEALCREFGWQIFNDLDGGNLERVINPDGAVQIVTLVATYGAGIATACPETNLKKTSGRLWEEVARCDPDWPTATPEFPFEPSLALEVFLVQADLERGIVRAELAKPRYHESDADRERLKSWIRRRILIDDQWTSADIPIVRDRREAGNGAPQNITIPDIPERRR